MSAPVAEQTAAGLDFRRRLLDGLPINVPERVQLAMGRGHSLVICSRGIDTRRCSLLLVQLQE